MERERLHHRKTTTKINRIERVADFFHLTIFENETAELTPIISRVFDARVDEKMQHLQRSLAARLDFFLIQAVDVAIADAEPRSIKFKFRFFIGRYPNANLIRLGSIYIFRNDQSRSDCQEWAHN